MIEVMSLLKKEIQIIRKETKHLRYQSLYAYAGYRQASADRLQEILDLLESEFYGYDWKDRA